MLSIEQAKSFCKKNGIRGIDIRGKTRFEFLSKIIIEDITLV